jgi:hypothetical protein
MGKIKEGLGPLIGNAGEFYVMAELLKRGIIAGLTPRNAPAFDILATNIQKTVSIRVKTKSEEIDVWQYSINKQGNIFRSIQEKGDLSVLVNLAEDVKNVRYFVIPTKIINDWLIKDFDDYINTPGVGGKPHSKANPKRTLSYIKYAENLAEYENNWASLWK